MKEERPMIEIDFITGKNEKKTVLFTYAQLKYFITHLEIANIDSQSKFAQQMNRYIH